MNKEQLIEEIKETVWYKQAANVKAYYIFINCRSATILLNAKLAVWSIKEGKPLEWYCPKDSFLKKAQSTIAEQKKDPKYILKIMGKCKVSREIIEKFYGEYLRTDFSNYNLKEIVKIIKELNQNIFNYWLNAYLCDAFDPQGHELLRAEMQKAGIKLTIQELDQMMRSNTLNFMQEERLAMLKLAKRVKEEISIEEAKEFLHEHAKKYFYIDNSWESTKILKVDDFIERLKEMLNVDIEAQIKDLTTNWEEVHFQLKEKHNIPEELMSLFLLYRNLFIMRDDRKYHTLLNNHIFDQVFMRISELLEIPFEELRFIIAEEIHENITKEELLEKIEQRKEIFTEAYQDKKSTLFCGEDSKQITTAIQKTLSQDSDVIKGSCACKGKVSGTVRVITGESHFSKFNDHEILVAPMTRPEYLSLMKKAKAVITDEGGVTCHAAIVARELGIPCIIGTQVATTKLHDGDFVEVDADNGVVKVIK